MDPGRGVRRHPLRGGGGDRQAHHRPPRGAQRVPPRDPDRDLRGARAGARGQRGGRDRADGRGAGRVLLGRRPARARRHGLRGGRRERRALPRHRPARADPAAAQARRRDGGRLRDRRRPRAAPRVRPHHRRGQRPLRPDGPARGLVRRWLRREPPLEPGGAEEGEGVLVPLPPVRRAAGARDGPGQHRRATRPARGRDRAVVPRDATALALRAAAREGELPCPRGRLRRDPAARPRREPPLLRERGGPGGARRLQAEAHPRLLGAPPPAVTEGRGGIAADRPSAARIWLMAARPRTLPAAVAPVLVGTALAATEGTFKALTFVAALLGALFIQVGTNLSNDYSDARRGADTEDRLGPVRVTAGGLVPPRQVLVATYVAFGLAVLAGAYLIATAGWELLLVGAASILAGVLYTGGPRPYGYEGLGEVFVFLFFGLVAVTGSYFAQVEELAWEAFVLAVPVGLLASAILVVNNVRDLETDRRAGKRTLAVRLGRLRSRRLYAVMVYVAFLCAPLPWLLGSDDLSAWLLLPWAALPLAVPVVRVVRNRADGPSLNGALARTGMLQLAFCALLSAGILAS